MRGSAVLRLAGNRMRYVTRPRDVVTYSADLSRITEEMLSGFFVGWPHPPDASQYLAILRGSSHVVLAETDGEVVGFINAPSDGVIAAFIPPLEVRLTTRGGAPARSGTPHARSAVNALLGGHRLRPAGRVLLRAPWDAAARGHGIEEPLGCCRRRHRIRCRSQLLPSEVRRHYPPSMSLPGGWELIIVLILMLVVAGYVLWVIRPRR